MCVYVFYIRMCVFSIPCVLVLTFPFLPYRSVHIARVMSIESVTLKNPLTRLRDRAYNSVTVIFQGPIDQVLSLERNILFSSYKHCLCPPENIYFCLKKSRYLFEIEIETIAIDSNCKLFYNI